MSAEFLSQPLTAAEDLSERIKKLYQMLDLDGSGSLSFQELHEGLKLLKCQVSL